MQILITKRLTLRPPLEVDAESVFQGLNNENVTKNISNLPSPYTLEDAQAWIARNKAPSNGCSFTIHRNRFIGVIDVRLFNDVYNLGYWLDEHAWGQGFISEAARAVLAHAFRTLPCDTIYSGAYQDNIASRKILEKMGFTPTKTITVFNTARQCTVECDKLQLTRDAFEKKFGMINQDVAA